MCFGQQVLVRLLSLLHRCAPAHRRRPAEARPSASPAGSRSPRQPACPDERVLRAALGSGPPARAACRGGASARAAPSPRAGAVVGARSPSGDKRGLRRGSLAQRSPTATTSPRPRRGTPTPAAPVEVAAGGLVLEGAGPWQAVSRRCGRPRERSRPPADAGGVHAHRWAPLAPASRLPAANGCAGPRRGDVVSAAPPALGDSRLCQLPPVCNPRPEPQAEGSTSPGRTNSAGTMPKEAIPDVAPVTQRGSSTVTPRN